MWIKYKTQIAFVIMLITYFTKRLFMGTETLSI